MRYLYSLYSIDPWRYLEGTISRQWSFRVLFILLWLKAIWLFSSDSHLLDKSKKKMILGGNISLELYVRQIWYLLVMKDRNLSIPNLQFVFNFVCRIKSYGNAAPLKRNREILILGGNISLELCVRQICYLSVMIAWNLSFPNL